eukprot:sb/3479553/
MILNTVEPRFTGPRYTGHPDLPGKTLSPEQNFQLQFDVSTITFDGILLKAEIGHGVTVLWDGLALARVRISSDVGRTCGLCGNNDGSASNDVSQYYSVRKDELKSFADSWAVVQSAYVGRCETHEIDASPVDFDPSYMTTLMKDSIFGPLLPISNRFKRDVSNDDLFENYMNFAAMDHAASGNSYLTCSNIRGYMMELADRGLVFDRWDYDVGCNSPYQVIAEGIRLGCPWTQANALSYLFQ